MTRGASIEGPWGGRDKITLTGLRAKGFHGVFDHEKNDGQDFVVDVTLSADLRAAGASDNLADTVNYAEVADLAIGHITGPSLDLIETLAERIAASCLTLAGVGSVVVTVHKPGAPIPHTFADVSVTVRRTRSTPVVIALGSNLGDREQTLASAIAALRHTPGVRVSAVASLVETDPVGGPDQADYLNTVALATTALAPAELLAVLHRIEARHGRTRTVRWGERTLDLDLIQYGIPGSPGEVRSDDPAVTLPHPRAAERAFVLVPWLDADPAARLRVEDDIVAVADQLAVLDATGVRPGPALPHHEDRRGGRGGH